MIVSLENMTSVNKLIIWSENQFCLIEDMNPQQIIVYLLRRYETLFRKYELYNLKRKWPAGPYWAERGPWPDPTGRSMYTF